MCMIHRLPEEVVALAVCDHRLPCDCDRPVRLDRDLEIWRLEFGDAKWAVELHAARTCGRQRVVAQVGSRRQRRGEWKCAEFICGNRTEAIHRPIGVMKR